MNTKNIKPEKIPDMDEKISSEEIESLRKQMYELQLEVDILKETINILKRHEREVSATGPASKDETVKE